MILSIKRLLTVLLCLLAFSAAGSAAAAPIPLGDEKAPFPSEVYYLADGKGYCDPSIEVRVEKLRVHDTEVTAARIKIADPSQIRTAMAGRYGSTSAVRPDVLAERANAVLACNGDYFNYNTAGYLVRQGVTYRESAKRTYDMLIIDEAGDFHIITAVDNTNIARLFYFFNIGIELPEYRQDDAVIHLHRSFKTHSDFHAPFLLVLSVFFHLFSPTV